ncbi:two-component regulator propeller domain-containing protein [Flammeovirgaceae bacterium SG7u.111]|nr:two-component regulator propeller domain-containing protein [Flammeovirgaceae bacterium SG7u.132]WPO36886.1 two-component regulator propeller domain-containing protein [Flammeovirgaceae bacterium SG7u.111]
MKRDHRKYILYTIGLFFIALHSVFPQTLQNQLRFKQLSRSEGLSSTIVNDFCQDYQGFIWIATEDGLNKYDGLSFKSYRFNGRDTTSLSNSSIKALLEDSSQRLWIATRGGLSLYDRKSDCFKNIRGLENLAIKEMVEVEPGKLWLATEYRGLVLFDTKSEKIDPSQFSPLVIKPAMSIEKGVDGDIWLGMLNDGLYKIDANTKEAVEVFSGVLVNDIAVDKIHNKVWAASQDSGLYSYDNSTGELARFHAENSSIPDHLFSVELDNEGILWVGTDGDGLCLFDGDSVVGHYIKNNVDQSSLSSQVIRDIFIDQKNDVWVGTYLGGVCFQNRQNNLFSVFKHDIDDPHSLSHNTVLSFEKDEKGRLWVGTDGGGLNVLDGNGFKHFNKDNSRLRDDVILSLYMSSAGELWIGGYQYGLYVYRNGEFENIDYSEGDSISLSSNSVWEIGEDSKGNIWAGTNRGGLNRLNLETGVITHFKHNAADSTSLSNNSIRAIFEDSKNRLWIGTFQGLNLFDPLTNTFTCFRHKDIRSNPRTDMVMSIAEDADGELWLGTYGGGLSRFNPEKNEFVDYNEDQGLGNDIVFGVIIAQDGSIWLTTSKGISRFFPLSETFVNYGESNGLQENGFMVGSYFQDKEGKIYAGGNAGFNVFDPSAVQVSDFSPPIVFTDFLIYNKPVEIGDQCSPLEKHISITDSITLTHLQTVFSLSFAALDYGNPKQIQYAYMLEGFDDEWNYVENRNFAIYTNLDPGEYTFKVKATNSEGVWNKNVASLTVTIAPPWWRTWWARVGAVVLVIGSIVSFYMFRIRVLKGQKTILEQKVQERTYEIFEKNKEISAQYKELQSSEEELSVQNEELVSMLDQLKKAQSQLVQSEKMASLGLLTAGIAHEINNPVNFIKSGITGLKMVINQVLELTKLFEGIDKDNVQEKYKEIERAKKSMKFDAMMKNAGKITHHIETGANRTAEIVKGLRSFSRSDNAKIAPYNISEGIDNNLLLLNHLLKGKVEVFKNIDEVPNIECSPSQVNQVLMNLLVNAAQAIEEKGSIDISVKMYEEEHVAITVEDTGPGICDQDLKRIFDPFFTTKEVGKGTGMGLSIVMGIIEDHHGWVDVKSELGKGTTFTVVLPIHQKG